MLLLLATVLLLASCIAAKPEPAGPQIGGCPVFPVEHFWNTPIDNLPVHSSSSNWIERISLEKGLHPDFGSGTWNGKRIGIPYNLADVRTPQVTFIFNYAEESDPGPYPLPSNALIEEGDDHHLLVVDTRSCKLYELYKVRQTTKGWEADSGAIFDLASFTLRPDGWTSADAAGLPILPGLVRYEEVAEGEIKHALRFTADWTSANHLWPARHHAATGDAKDPPMGMRVRLRADFDISGFSPNVQVILKALKKYGMVLADNGSDWFISGVPDERWNNDVLVSELGKVKGSDLEVVDTGSMKIEVDSGRAHQP